MLKSLLIEGVKKIREEGNILKIAICDDNQITANYIEEYISGLPIKNISCEVFISGNDLIKYLNKSSLDGDFNIYFMDIEMPGIDGIETATYIREKDSKALIIFITEHKEYVYQVFEVLPFRFLIKPLSKEQLNKVLHEAIENIQTMKQLFFFKIERKRYQLSSDEILYFESKGRKVRLVMEIEEYEFYDKLSNIKKNVDDNLFLQIHSSYLVNMEYIRVVTETEVVMRGGAILPISKKFRNEAKKQHLNFVEWRCGR